MNMTSLKSQYDARSIYDIEADIRGNRASAQSFTEKLTGALFYLEQTKRFKENPKYKATSFDLYLRTEFGLSTAQYQTWRALYVQFSEEVKTLGVGVVQTAVHNLGIKTARAALQQAKPMIDATTPPHKVSAAINSTPAVKAAMKEREHKRRVKTVAKQPKSTAAPDIVKERDELLEQNVKLKATVLRLQEENEALKGELEMWRNRAANARKELTPRLRHAAMVPGSPPEARV